MKKKIPFLLLALSLSGTSLFACNGDAVPSDSLPSSSDSILSDSEEEDPDQKAAEDVIKMIDALSDASTEEEVNAALAAYNNLTQRQKNLVTNYQKLQSWLKLIEGRKALVEIEQTIAALDEENPDGDAVVAARQAYNDFLATYGQEWQEKINKDLMDKLARCEAKVCAQVLSPLFAKALSLDINVPAQSVQFTLQAERINELIKAFPLDIVEKVPGYTDYLSTLEEVEKTNSILDYKEPLMVTTQQTAKFLSVLEKHTNADYGYTFDCDLGDDEDLKAVTNDGNIQFGFKADMSHYKKIAFFVSWPLDNSIIKVLNEERDVYIDTVAIEKNVFTYYEIPTSLFTDLFGDNDFTHIGAWFEHKSVGAVDGYKFTNIVGIGVHPDQAQAAVNNVDALIEALTEESGIEEIEEARKAYDDLLTVYSKEWQDKVKPENVTKLIHLENAMIAKSINLMIEEANSIDITSNSNKARFTLLCRSIIEKYEGLDESEKEAIVGYDTLLSKKQTTIKTTDVLFNDTFVEISNGRPLEISETRDYGKTYLKTRPSPSKTNLEIMGIDKNADWSKYNSFGLFIEYDVANTENVVFCPNGEWGTDSNPIALYRSGTLVDAERHIYYYEYPLSSITEPFTKDSYFSIYLSQKAAKIRVSGIVCFYSDIEAINRQIAEANALELNNNVNFTHFVDLGDEIERSYNSLQPSDKSRVVGYDDYLAKKETLGTSCGLLWNELFTVEAENWPSLVKYPDETYGAWFRHNYDSAQNSAFKVFANVANATQQSKDWSSHEKVGCFLQAECEITQVDLVVDYLFTNPLSSITPMVHNAGQHIYYCEFDVSSLTSAFTNNLVFNITPNGETTFIAITSLIALDA